MISVMQDIMVAIVIEAVALVVIGKAILGKALELGFTVNWLQLSLVCIVSA